MNPSIISAIVRKDLTAYRRDRLWIILSVLMLVVLIVIFWLLPSTVDESIKLGISHGDLGPLSAELDAGGMGAGQESLDVVDFGTDSAALEQAVAGSLSDSAAAGLPEGAQDVAIGIDLPADFGERVRAGSETEVTIFVDAGVPPEIRGGMSSFVRELAFTLAEQTLPVSQPNQQEVVLGEDRAGRQIPLREKMRPMFAFFVLLVESFALASLIAEEIYSRTATALLVTPAKTADLLMAKALTGTLLALGQALVFLLAVRGFAGNAPALLLAVVLGAVMASAVGMIAGSAGRDFMGTIFVGLVFFVPLAIPAFSGLFPGTASSWVTVLPSYGIVEVIVGATAYAEGWRDLAPELSMAIAWDAVLLVAAFLILKRRVETL